MQVGDRVLVKLGRAAGPLFLNKVATIDMVHSWGGVELVFDCPPSITGWDRRALMNPTNWCPRQLRRLSPLEQLADQAER